MAHPHYHDEGKTHWKMVVAFSNKPITKHQDRRIMDIVQFTNQGIQFLVNQFVIIPTDEKKGTIGYPLRNNGIVLTNPNKYGFLSLEYLVK